MLFGRNIALDGGFISENNIGVEMERTDRIRISNTDFRGYSDISKDLTMPPLMNKPCISVGHHNPSGLRLMTTRHETYDGGEDNGAKLFNVNFSEFDQIDGCDGGFPIDFNTIYTQDDHFDYITSFDNVSFNANSPIIDTCSAFTAGIRDIVITDVDGRSDPLNLSNGPSAIISNNLQMKKFANGCVSYPGCISYCPNTCLRNFNIYTDQSETDISLVVTRKEDGEQNYYGSIYDYDDDINEAQYYNHIRRYSLSLPYGHYEVSFVNGEDELVWPRFVYDLWSYTLPECNETISPAGISILEPEADCSDLIFN